MNIRVKFDVLTNVIFFLADLTPKKSFFYFSQSNV